MLYYAAMRCFLLSMPAMFTRRYYADARLLLRYAKRCRRHADACRRCQRHAYAAFFDTRFAERYLISAL